jgi:hypothetical protein
MTILFNRLGAVALLILTVSCFTASKASADTLFTYSYSASVVGGDSFSWTTEPIVAATRDTVLSAAQLTSTSVTGPLFSSCTITFVDLDDTDITSGDQGTFFGGLPRCDGEVESVDRLPFADYSTVGTYMSVFGDGLFVQTDTLVVSASQTPEPSTSGLLLCGVGLIVAMRKRL